MGLIILPNGSPSSSSGGGVATWLDAAAGSNDFTTNIGTNQTIRAQSALATLLHLPGDTSIDGARLRVIDDGGVFRGSENQLELRASTGGVTIDGDSGMVLYGDRPWIDLQYDAAALDWRILAQSSDEEPIVSLTGATARYAYPGWEQSSFTLKNYGTTGGNLADMALTGMVEGTDYVRASRILHPDTPRGLTIYTDTTSARGDAAVSVAAGASVSMLCTYRHAPGVLAASNTTGIMCLTDGVAGGSYLLLALGTTSGSAQSPNVFAEIKNQSGGSTTHTQATGANIVRGGLYTLGVVWTSGSALALYIDGYRVANAASALSLTNACTTFRIGNTSFNGDPMRGSIGDVMVFNSALTAAQMKEHAQVARKVRRAA
jgi:hypothetical protein